MTHEDPTLELREYSLKHDYLICIDSDGCAFDTMEIKHKECFIPNIIQYWGLQPVSKFARQAAEFVNLYSKDRGCNRFVALFKTFDLLGDWEKVRARGVTPPAAPNLRRWLEEETKLGNPALKAYCAAHPDETDMARALAWSIAVNETVEAMVHGVPPFPHVRESLQKAETKADMLVCSATPHEALVREWEEHGISQYVYAIAGQEQGSKKEHIAMARAGRSDSKKVLMVGDAPGDMKAAKANDALFFPINPGEEEASWKRFHDEGLERFFSGTYAGDYEAALITEFDTYLPELPPWKSR